MGGLGPGSVGRVVLETNNVDPSGKEVFPFSFLSALLLMFRGKSPPLVLVCL